MATPRENKIIERVRQALGEKVSKEKYNELLTSYNRLKEEHDALQKDYQSQEATLSEIEGIIDAELNPKKEPHDTGNLPKK